MSYDDTCNCGQHIPVCLRVARARSPSGLASGECADALRMVVFLTAAALQDRLWSHLKNTLNYESDDNDTQDRRNHARVRRERGQGSPVGQGGLEWMHLFLLQTKPVMSLSSPLTDLLLIQNNVSKAEKNQVPSNVDRMSKLQEQYSGPARRQRESDASDQKAKVQEQGTGTGRRQRTREEILQML